MSTKCLVTGAAGFIGSHLCEALLTRNYEVIGIDGFTETYPRAQKEANISCIREHPNMRSFHLIAQDIKTTDWEPLLDGVDFIFHLAAEPGVRSSWGEGFARYVERNILETQILLEKCRSQKIKKLVFASSSSVYGNRGATLLSEEDRCQPFSPYGVTKLAAENLCLAYWENFGIPVVCMRYFTVFGPRQRPDMGFHRFLKNALEGKELAVFGDGNQTRDFTYVSDAVEGTILGAERGKRGGIYNIGGGCITSVNEVLTHIRQALAPQTVRISFVESSKGDVLHTRSQCERAVQDLGFQPKVSLKDGLTRELEWLRSFSP